MTMYRFRKALEVLIHEHEMDTACKTPDWLLADYLTDCLKSFKSTNETREELAVAEPEEEGTNEVGCVCGHNVQNHLQNKNEPIGSCNYRVGWNPKRYCQCREYNPESRK